ncbi:glycosyltransferase family 2 protein [Aestuariivivens sediminicola]|uniref:glycosyltransferase family 2 protein n=1 Tax=Aestuariivivens sediminicola TaxID=2913560 RepID=UPI001F56A0D0|nr:glycosyltransferase family 2 protein [Aestuariivivens sediminicola]
MIFEILISTMNKKDFTFLKRMFANNTLEDYRILIINQTTKDNLLESELTNVRVINSFEKGLSKSRNLAIRNAMGDICLIADDDITYKKGFEKDIISAFKNNPEADFITFQMQDDSGKLFKTYPDVHWHNRKSVITVNSVVISFRRENILNSGISFNPYFGLGAQFPLGEEYIFLRDALKANLKLLFIKKIILTHKYLSSGRLLGKDSNIFARSAIMRKYSGKLAYLRLVKHVFHGLQNREIGVLDICSKFKVGIKGILSYESLLKQRLVK